MGDKTADALVAASGKYTRDLQAGAPDLGPLTAAARAHIAASRAHDQVLAEYSAVLDARDAGEPYDKAAFEALAQELGVLRLAVATVNGYPPGLPPAVTAEEGS